MNDHYNIGPEDGALVGTHSVTSIVAAHQQAEEKIREAFSMVRGACKLLDETVSLGGRSTYVRGRHRTYSFDESEAEDVLVNLRRATWEAIVERSRVRAAMSIEAWQKLEKQISNDEPPAVTVENVEALIAQFRADAPSMLEASVKEVFEFLRPHNDRYKTNTQFEIGERVILSSCVSRGYGRTWDTGSYRDQHLIALENVFMVLDGKVPQRTGYYADLAVEIKRIPIGDPCHGGTPYFEFRGHRNGNLHLRFRRMDLVRRLNAVAGGARLRSAA